MAGTELFTSPTDLTLPENHSKVNYKNPNSLTCKLIECTLNKLIFKMDKDKKYSLIREKKAQSGANIFFFFLTVKNK